MTLNRFRKKRKFRTIGSDLDFDVSHIFGWPPKNFNTPAYKKLCKRISLGLCIGCGNEKCVCKSGYLNGPDWYNDDYVIHNFWKKNFNDLK
jgi:hypothetical protein